MKIDDAIKKGTDLLGNDKVSKLFCEAFLAHLLSKSREYIFAHKNIVLSKLICEDFFLGVEKHVAGYPLAYLTNNKEFYGLDFYVDERVLIPRPETELLVSEVLKFLEDSGRILDVGTGSAAILISVLKNAPLASGVGVDISSDALDVARVNASKHEVSDRCVFLNSDLLDNVSGDFDVVCANLPYIGTKKHNFVDKNVSEFEPSCALFAGDDGLLLYKKLFQQLVAKKVWFKCFIGEFGFGQIDDLSILLNKYFEHKWEVKKDLQGISRVFIIRV